MVLSLRIKNPTLARTLQWGSLAFIMSSHQHSVVNAQSCDEAIVDWERDWLFEYALPEFSSVEEAASQYPTWNNFRRGYLRSLDETMSSEVFHVITRDACNKAGVLFKDKDCASALPFAEENAKEYYAKGQNVLELRDCMQRLRMPNLTDAEMEAKYPHWKRYLSRFSGSKWGPIKEGSYYHRYDGPDGESRSLDALKKWNNAGQETIACEAAEDPENGIFDMEKALERAEELQAVASCADYVQKEAKKELEMVIPEKGNSKATQLKTILTRDAWVYKLYSALLLHYSCVVLCSLSGAHSEPVDYLPSQYSLLRFTTFPKLNLHLERIILFI